eukprot:2223791-Amphidinium_carterae.2
MAWALLNRYEVRTGDFSVAFTFTPVPEDVHIYIEAPPEQAEKCLFIRRKLKVMVTVHVDDPTVAGTSDGIRMFFKLVGTELKVKEKPSMEHKGSSVSGIDIQQTPSGA